MSRPRNITNHASRPTGTHWAAIGGLHLLNVRRFRRIVGTLALDPTVWNKGAVPTTDGRQMRAERLVKLLRKITRRQHAHIMYPNG